MSRKIIKNIASIIGVSTQPLAFKKGVAMSVLESIENGYIIIDHDKIHSFGPMTECPEIADTFIDAKGGMVMPTWCDSHTHVVWAASREDEYVMRLKGKSYQEIAEAGGGILNSAKKLQLADEESLYHSALNRLNEVASTGTGAIEIKSGYGLSLESEIKMLRVIRRLKESSDLTIKATFLGAHAIPQIYRDNRDQYIKLVTNEMLPLIASEGLAEYCDVFCDKGFFTIEETDQILESATKLGLKSKIHANELANSGGVQVGIKHNAISVDHLEMIDDQEITDLLKSNTIPTVLPSCSFFLNIHYAPARKMIDAGLGIAIATDYNPGSSPSGNVPLLMALACNNMRITPQEAFNGVTINGAHAMEIENSHGSITPGSYASLIITKPIPNLDYMTYHFGKSHIDKVMLKGKII